MYIIDICNYIYVYMYMKYMYYKYVDIQIGNEKVNVENDQYILKKKIDKSIILFIL